MARAFASASSERITTSIGALNYAGPMTHAVLIRSTVDAAARTWFRTGTGASASIINQIDTSNRPLYSNQAAQVVAPTITLTAANGWCLLATSKASGTTAPRFHKYVVSTNVWSHENGGSTIADPSTPGTNGFLGSQGASGFWEGDIAIIGAWNVVLSDAQIESLPFSLLSWFQVQPKGLWVLDQAAVAQTVRDLSGNGANQSAIVGTTVATSSVPVFSYGVPALKVDIQPAAVGGGGTSGPLNLLLMGAG